MCQTHWPNWWAKNAAQARALAREVQQAVDPQVRVMVDAEDGPVWVGEVPHALPVNDCANRHADNKKMDKT